MPHALHLTHLGIATLALGLLACSAEQAEPDAGRVPRLDAAMSADASVHMDAAPTDATPVDATPLDAVPPDAARDADPRSLEDLWSPDFGPVPEDMPEEIRWMHGRLWCPGERPPRVLADGSSECVHAEVPTDPALQSDEPITPDTLGCAVWPSRTSELGYPAPWGGPGAWITCNAENTLCCAGLINIPPPCGWQTFPYASSSWGGDRPTPEAAAWAEANGLRLISPENDTELPEALRAAFPTALNNCHPICKAPACGQ